MPIGLCDMRLERPSTKGCFPRGEIGTGQIELEFEVKIVFANVPSLSFFFFLFNILTAVKGAIWPQHITTQTSDLRHMLH